MASHISNVILSLKRPMFMDEKGVYKISINTLKEMEKKDGNLVFLKEKLSLFIQRLGFNNLYISCICRVCSTFIWSPLPRLIDVCVRMHACWQMCTRQVHSRLQRLRNSWPGRPLRLLVVCEVHIYTLIQNTSHVNLVGKLGCEQVTRSLVDAVSNLQGEAQVLYPKIHENLRNCTSTLNALQTNFCHWIKLTL